LPVSWKRETETGIDARRESLSSILKVSHLPDARFPIPFPIPDSRLSLMRPLLLLLLCAAVRLHAQTIDDSIPPGANFDKAQFRLWLPPESPAVRAVLVLVPGSNGDGRGWAEDTVWQRFAAKNRLAIVACRFTDKPHDQNFIEDYVDVRRGSGQALLDVLGRLAQRSAHAELATAPLLMWGMSAGGQFDYEMTAWKPERVAAFVVNKGGIYYTALTSRAARQVPGMLFIGGKDLEQRVETITGLFAVNRRGGALWALAEEPGVGHVIGRSRDVSMVFFEDVLAARLASDGSLKTLDERTGMMGDLHTKEFAPLPEKLPGYPTAWLPTERAARMWRAMLTETPFPPL
jgi:poly(3-hydroxybutyrate) depolymerase